MVDISVRKLDEITATRLRRRAADHGVSMEEEVRQILRAAVMAPPRLGDVALSLFGREHGIDLEIPEPLPSDPPVFSP